MRFLKDLIKSSHDIEGEQSLLVHTLAGCNLDCYKCHNRDLVENAACYESIDMNELIDRIESFGYMFTNIIISGGEPTLFGRRLPILLYNIRNVYDGNIVLYTNGTKPRAIETILAANLVDRIFLDVKMNPFKSHSDYTIEDSVINPRSGIENYISDIKKSIHLISSSSIKNRCEFRTVKYPQYTEEYLEDLRDSMSGLNVKYVQNEFVNLDV